MDSAFNSFKNTDFFNGLTKFNEKSMPLLSALKLLDVSANNKVVFSKFSVSKIKCSEESSGYED